MTPCRKQFPQGAFCRTDPMLEQEGERLTLSHMCCDRMCVWWRLARVLPDAETDRSCPHSRDGASSTAASPTPIQMGKNANDGTSLRTGIPSLSAKSA